MAMTLFNYLIEKRRDFIFNRILKKHNLSKANSIDTWTNKKELRILYSLARNLKRGSCVLEIGSYLGASTCYIGAAIEEIEGHVFCIDTWNNETIPEGERDTFDEFCNNTFGINRYLTLIRKNSKDVTDSELGRKFSLVFIDGDHSYPMVLSDFKLSDQITHTGAIVVFHDAIHFPGVTRVIGQALSSGNWKIGGFEQNLFWIIKKDDSSNR